MKIAQKSREHISISALAQELSTAASKLKRRLTERSDHGQLTPSQVSVVMHMERSNAPMTVSRLAQTEGMRPQSMAAIVAALESAGLVSGAPDPKDGRQTLLSLTEHYRKWARKERTAQQTWLARTIETRLSAQERRKLAEAVDLLKRLTED